MSVNGFRVNGTIQKYNYNSLDNIPKLEIDKTLTENGVPADAKATGDRIRNLQSLVGSPLVASTVSGMTDKTKIYVYTGSETGYTYGNWYYHNGTSWVSGGVYNSLAVDLDTTLTISGKAADAKAVGDTVDNVLDTIAPIFTPGIYNKGDLVRYEDNLYECISKTSSGAAWDATKWQIADLGSLIKYLHDYIALPYASGSTVQIYEKGALCFYDHKLYRAIEGVTIIPSTPFDYTKWERVYIGSILSELSELKDDLDNKVDVNQGVQYSGKTLGIDENGNVSVGDYGISDAIKTALLACFENVAWINNQGQTYYNALYDALYPTPQPIPPTPPTPPTPDSYIVLSNNDFSDSRGFSGFSVVNGTVTYSGALQFSVASLDVGINSIIADTPTQTLPRGTWTVFCKVDDNTYYITDGGATPNLFVFRYDSDTQKFTAEKDNTLATITLGDEYIYNPAKIKMDLSDNELLLYNGETDKLIYKITNANCIGFWAQNAGSCWSAAKIKYDMRIPTLSDIVEWRTVPEIQINSTGTLTCGSTKSFWLFAFNSGINSIKYYHTGAASGKVAAWLVYKKVDDNTYYCTDGYDRFRFEYDSSNNKFTATNISSETEIQVLYGDDKKSTYLANGMYVTASLKNNALKVLSSYGYSFIIPDANCLGFWGISAVTLKSFKVGGEI